MIEKIFKVIIILTICSCSLTKEVEKGTTKSNCEEKLLVFEKGVLSSCPIHKGAKSVIEYLENKQEFERNKKYDFGNGSVRFKAKNALIYGFPLLDDKSIFLLNYDINTEGYENWILFQAIYYFGDEEAKATVLRKMKKVIEKDLNLRKEIQYDILDNPYERYYFPCGSGINLKHGVNGDKYVINILWARESS